MPRVRDVLEVISSLLAEDDTQTQIGRIDPTADSHSGETIPQEAPVSPAQQCSENEPLMGWPYSPGRTQQVFTPPTVVRRGGRARHTGELDTTPTNSQHTNRAGPDYALRDYMQGYRVSMSQEATWPYSPLSPNTPGPRLWPDSPLSPNTPGQRLWPYSPLSPNTPGPRLPTTPQAEPMGRGVDTQVHTQGHRANTPQGTAWPYSPLPPNTPGPCTPQPVQTGIETRPQEHGRGTPGVRKETTHKGGNPHTYPPIDKSWMNSQKSGKGKGPMGKKGRSKGGVGSGSNGGGHAQGVGGSGKEGRPQKEGEGDKDGGKEGRGGPSNSTPPHNSNTRGTTDKRGGPGWDLMSRGRGRTLTSIQQVQPPPHRREPQQGPLHRPQPPLH